MSESQYEHLIRAGWLTSELAEKLQFRAERAEAAMENEAIHNRELRAALILAKKKILGATDGDQFSEHIDTLRQIDTALKMPWTQ